MRERAVRIIAETDAYAGLLILMHTYNLLTGHADRSTIRPEDLVLLDKFLERQLEYQAQLRAAIAADASLAPHEKSDRTILEHFRLLQACDNLSLLSCVAFTSPTHLLHPLPRNDGSTVEVKVLPTAPRRFQLTPWPFHERELTFHFPARHVGGRKFGSSAELGALFSAAAETHLEVTLTQ